MIAWISVDSSFRSHRKVKRLSRLLGRDCARWLPIWLWIYCVESARDGDLSKLSDEDLADVLDYDGDAAELRRALIDAEFLTSDGRVVGWAERYAEKFEFYRRRAKAAADARWSKNPSPEPPTQDQTSRAEMKKHEQASLKDASSTPPTDDELRLRFPGIDIAAERAACAKKFPRAGERYFVEFWLPKAERPLAVTATAKSSDLPEPRGWEKFVKEHYQNGDSLSNSSWADLEREHQRAIRQAMSEATNRAGHRRFANDQAGRTDIF